MADYSNHKVFSTSRKQMLFEPGLKRKWYETELGWEHVEPKDGVAAAVETDNLERNRQMENKAAQLLEHDIELYKKYQNFKENRSNFGWMDTVLKTGALGDKMAAHTVLIQDSAPHNLKSVEQLVKLVDPRGKRECLMAADTLKDILLSDLLPKSRKLLPFGTHPIGALEKISQGNKDTADLILMLWHYESRLKQLVITFVGALNKLAQDTIAATKTKAIKIMTELLIGHPEQEQMLLRNIVNKIGDPDRKMASLASVCIAKIVDVHPVMKEVIVNEVERLIFRPHVTNKSCFYAICFLNRLIFDKNDNSLAAKLIAMYLALFKAAMKRGEVDSKMMSALLTGLNRAFPYADQNHDKVCEQMDSLYKTVHKHSFNVSVQALTVLFHVLNSQSHFNDRFYCALYRKLLDPCLKNMSKPALFLNLVYKTLKSDEMEARVYAFVKRILQIIPEQSPNVMCGSLVVISEILKGHSTNLLTKKKEIELDDGEEFYLDVDDEEENLNADNKSDKKKSSNKKQASKASWVHRRNFGDPNPHSYSSITTVSFYDPFHRNPLFAKAENASAFELLKLSKHYHPSVALFAQTLLNGDNIIYSGDPLLDFTLIRFLDRFVFRNPKKANPSNDYSQRNVFGKRTFYVPLGVRSVPVNKGEFISSVKKVPIDEKFFYNYFIVKRKTAEVKAKAAEEDDDIISVASDEFEAAMDRFEPEDFVDEFELDFAHDVKTGSSKKAEKKKKKGKITEESESDEGDDEAVFGDEFLDSFKEFEKDIKAAKSGGVDDLEDLEDEFGDEFDDDDEFSEVSKFDHKKGNKKSNNKNKKNIFLEDDDDDDDFDLDIPKSGSKPKKMKTLSRNSFGGMGKYFASADQFASILEENASSKVDTISLQAMVNRDNAAAKQIRWEEDRDRFVRGVDWKSNKRRMGRGGGGGAKRGGTRRGGVKKGGGGGAKTRGGGAKRGRGFKKNLGGRGATGTKAA